MSTENFSKSCCCPPEPSDSEGAILLKFSGAHRGDAEVVPVVSYLADAGHDNQFGVEIGFQRSIVRYPLPACVLSEFRVEVTVNPCIATVTLEVYRNGVATGQSVAIGAGLTGLFTDLVNTSTFSDDDLLDIRVSSTSAGVNTIYLSATLKSVSDPLQVLLRQYDFTFDSFESDGTANEVFAAETAFDFSDFSTVNLISRLCTQAYVDGGSGTIRVRYGGTSGLPDGTLLVASPPIVVLLTALVSALNAVAKPVGPQLVKLTLQNDTVGQKTILDAGSIVIREKT